MSHSMSLTPNELKFLTDVSQDVLWRTGNQADNYATAEERQAGRGLHVPHVIYVEQRPSNWCFLDFGTHINVSTSPSQQDKEDDRAWWAAVIGGIVAVGASLVGGALYSVWSRQRECVRKIQEVQRQLADDFRARGLNPFDDRLLASVERLMEGQLSLETQKMQRLASYFFGVVGVGIGAAALSVGGIASLPWLMVAGEVALLASAMWIAVNAGMHLFSDTSELQEKQACKASEILQGIHQRQESGITPLDVEPVTEQPVVGEVVQGVPLPLGYATA